MGIFNRSIPKYTGNFINNEIEVSSPPEEYAFIDDIFDPVLNARVRERLLDQYGNPITATLAGYTELVNNALLGNKQQGGTMLPGIGILSSFGRSLDKSGDIILGTLTEGVKGMTGQGIESPLHNIFVQDEDYSGQRILAAAANSMAKLANAPELTPSDFKGAWTLPSMGIELATDPSILGGNLIKLSKGTGAAAEVGQILRDYDDIMARAAIDATAPGLRQAGKKFGQKLHKLTSNLSSEKEYEDTMLTLQDEFDLVSKDVAEFGTRQVTADEYDKVLSDIEKRAKEAAAKFASDTVASNFKDLQKNVYEILGSSKDASKAVKSAGDEAFEKLMSAIASKKTYIKKVDAIEKLSGDVSAVYKNKLGALGEIIDFMNVNTPKSDAILKTVDDYHGDIDALISDLNLKKFVDSDFGGKYWENMKDVDNTTAELMLSLDDELSGLSEVYNTTDVKTLLTKALKGSEDFPLLKKKLNKVLEHQLSLKDNNKIPYKSGTLKISQSLSKAPYKTQIIANNQIQQIYSDIITKAVELGIVDAKNIDETTLPRIVAKLKKDLNAPTPKDFAPGKYDIALVKPYIFDNDYINSKLSKRLKDVYSTSKRNVSKFKKYSEARKKAAAKSDLKYKILSKIEDLPEESLKIAQQFGNKKDFITYKTNEILKTLNDFYNSNGIIMPKTVKDISDTAELFSKKIFKDYTYGKLIREFNITTPDFLNNSDTYKEFSDLLENWYKISTSNLKTYNNYLKYLADNPDDAIDLDMLLKGFSADSASVSEHFKSAESFTRFKIGEIKKTISDFYSDKIAGAKKQNSLSESDIQALGELFNTKITSNYTYQDLINEIIMDDDLGLIPLKFDKDLFTNASKRLPGETGISASKTIEEFQTMYDLVSLYAMKGYEVPINYKGSFNIDSEQLRKVLGVGKGNEITLDAMSKAQKALKEASVSKELLDFITDEVKLYDKNIGAYLGGRLPDDDIVKTVQYARKNGTLSKNYLDVDATKAYGSTTEDLSVGYSKAINDILSRVQFEKPSDIVEFMNKKFDTSYGKVSLADLGFEVTQLPNNIKDTTRKYLMAGFLKPITFDKDKAPTTMYAIVSKYVKGNINTFLSDTDKLAKSKYTDFLEPSKIISEKMFRKKFQYGMNMGYQEFTQRLEHLKKVLASYDKVPENLDKIILDTLTDPDVYTKSLYNNYLNVYANPKLQYLNRLRPDLGKVEFSKIEEVIKDGSQFEGVIKTTKEQLDKSIEYTLKHTDRMQDMSFEVEKSLEELSDAAFKQVASNPTMFFDKLETSKQLDIINKMCPNETPLTDVEYQIFKDHTGGKDPVFKTIVEKHPKQTRLLQVLSKEMRVANVAKQDRDIVKETPQISNLIDDSIYISKKLEMDNNKKLARQVMYALDHERGYSVKGTDFFKDLVLSKGHKHIKYGLNERNLANSAYKSIKNNVDKLNSAAGEPIIKIFNRKADDGYIISYYLTGKQKSFKKLFKSKGIKLEDVLFEPADGRYSSKIFSDRDAVAIKNHFSQVQNVASDWYKKIGFEYNDPDYFKHTLINDEDVLKKLHNEFYADIDVKTAENLADMVINLGYAGDLRGVYGMLPNTRSFAGGIYRYPKLFSTDLTTVTKSTFTKGVFANEKFQTTMSLFNNNEFRLNTYCKNVDDVRNILNSEGNMRNLVIASPTYDKHGMLTGFKQYDNFSDVSLGSAIKDENAIFVPKHIFSTLDKACKQHKLMSNKVYAAINRYLVAPFKVGVLLNPGFIVGNASDAYLKQATTMANKYGTSVNDELVNVADSIREVMHLNNSFSRIYDKYIEYCLSTGKELKPSDKIYTQVANSKSSRDKFIEYLNGIDNGLTEAEQGLSKVWIYLNMNQPTDSVTKELLGDAKTLNYAKNPFDRILYGLHNYNKSDIRTYGALNNPLSNFTFDVSENIESTFRAGCVLNDLKHQGIDLTEFAKQIGSDETSGAFRVKMLNAINAMHNANFDYNSMSPLLEDLQHFVPFPTFWLKNTSYWFDMLMNHPQYIDAAVTIQDNLWRNEDTEHDEFKAEAKARGAIPMSAITSDTDNKGLSKFFRGIYKPSPLQSMYSAFNTINEPLTQTVNRTHPFIQSGIAAASQIPGVDNLTTHLMPTEDIRYRPYSTNPFERNIKATDDKFNPIKYAVHRSNPFERTINTALRTPKKVKAGTAQLSDFLPSVFQPDFSKK